MMMGTGYRTRGICGRRILVGLETGMETGMRIGMMHFHGTEVDTRAWQLW